MIQAIIIDDEQHCIEWLSTMITEGFSNKISLIGSYKSVEEGISGINELKPDLVFLDIHLNNETGFDLLRQFSKIDFHLIFVTAYDKYAIQAFKFSAVDFLLKPVSEEDLHRAIEKLSSKISYEDKAKKYDTLLHNIKSAQTNRRICISNDRGIVAPRISDIVYCVSNSNYTHIFLNDMAKVTVSKTLKKFEELLEEYDFFRTHQSYLVNMAYVVKYEQNKDGGNIFLSYNNQKIPVAIRRKEEFLKRLKHKEK